MAANPKSIVLTDNVLMAVAGRGDILREFPFFRLPPGGPRKTCCHRRANQGALTGRLRVLREALIRLPKDKLAVLKRLMGAGALVLFVRGARGMEQHTL